MASANQIEIRARAKWWLTNLYLPGLAVVYCIHKTFINPNVTIDKEKVRKVIHKGIVVEIIKND